MKKFTLVLFACLLANVLAMAQVTPVVEEPSKFSGVVGVGLDTDTQFHPAAGAALITEVADKTLSFSGFNVRGDVDRKPIVTFMQGVMYEALKYQRFTLYGNANGGVSQSKSATTGMASFGGIVGYDLKPNLELIIGLLGNINPSEPDQKLKIMAAFRLK